MTELNRLLQRSYRGRVLDLAHNKNRYARKIPQPAGPQEIVYGDKVINIRNKSRRQYYPERPDVLEYVANGEIGVVTGPFRAKGRHTPLNRLEVEFSTQLGTAYKFWPSELGGDDNSPILELAYAVTIHKSQGSEFVQTFVVLPNPCRLLSRELLYTALTRQRDHVAVLMQGELTDLAKYSNVACSETAARLTNLFDAPAPVEVDGRFLEAGLIHKTRKGIAVRSKSEVIIADLLFSKQIEFQYEQPLTVEDGSWRLPDFTIEDDTTGRTIVACWVPCLLFFLYDLGCSHSTPSQWKPTMRRAAARTRPGAGPARLHAESSSPLATLTSTTAMSGVITMTAAVTTSARAITSTSQQLPCG